MTELAGQSFPSFADAQRAVIRRQTEDILSKKGYGRHGVNARDQGFRHPPHKDRLSLNSLRIELGMKHNQYVPRMGDDQFQALIESLG